MSYTKQTWAIGDKITSAKLNHMEDGISSAIKFIAMQFPDDPAADPYIEYSYNDIIGYINNGTLVVITGQFSQGTMAQLVRWCMHTNSGYTVILDDTTGLQADTDTENMTVLLAYTPSSGGSDDGGIK